MFTRGQLSPGDFSNQIHDFDLGIRRSGLFWTTSIDDSSVDVDFDDGRASMVLDDVKLKDYFNIPNALMRGDQVPAHVSLRVRWKGPAVRSKVHDTANQFEGVFKQNTATLWWSGRGEGFRFGSDPPETSQLEFAVLGDERNGRFFD